LLFPALAPAAKAGLRLLLRAGRASGRASFRGLLPRALEAGFPVAFEPLV
jgi:hypothetical protein